MMERELCAPHDPATGVRSVLVAPATVPVAKEALPSASTHLSSSPSIVAQATTRSRVRFEWTVAPSFRSVQLWTVRVHAPFKRVGSVRGGDLTISVCEEASSAAKIARCSRPTVWLVLFFAELFRGIAQEVHVAAGLSDL